MEMFEIGIIVKPQGIKGEMRVLPTTDDPTRFALLIGHEISIKTGVKTTTHKLTAARQQKGIVIIKLESITDRNAAERLVKSTILIPPEKALPLSSDEYYIRDLIGLKAETEAGEYLGKIASVLSTNANDVYVIEEESGESFMVPAIKDVVIKVLIQEGKIIIRLLEGLKEETRCR